MAALGIWALLYALGLALGLSAVDPSHPATAKASGIFTGIWSLLVPLVALFVGGAVAGRGAGLVTKGGGALHGLVMWGLTTLVGAWVLANLLGAVMGGAAAVGQEGLRAGASAMGGAQQFGLNAEDALGPINEKLQSEGKPPVTPEQLNAATKSALNDAVRQGKLDKQVLVTAIDENTALDRQDAEDVANRVEEQFQSFTEKVKGGALQVADTSGKIFWGVFGALFLGLISAVLGAMVGVSRRQVELAELASEPVVVTHDTTGFPPQQPLHQ